MRKYRLYQVDAFTTERFCGNPAGVVPNADGLEEGEMRLIARELNNSETAFIFAADGAGHDVRVRFFTPTCEVPSCGHATIAAHYVRALERSLPSCVVVQKIRAGILPVEVIREAETYRIVMTQGAIEFSEPFTSPVSDEILAGLGLAPDDRDERCPIQIVSTGHSKVLVGVRSRSTVNRIRPDLIRLSEISGSIDCNGYFVFTLDSGCEAMLTHGRMFAPAIGIPEDPVTGNANGPLGAYLVKHGLAEAADGELRFRAQQGEAMGRPGIVDVSVKARGSMPTVVRVGGRAVVVFQSELEL
ncbi:MAG: PhzF family isomerase [Gemmatimonadota bacterium]|nr:MAG: PhzF family isomerase [Gemmatimonadota bacterium]